MSKTGKKLYLNHQQRQEQLFSEAITIRVTQKHKQLLSTKANISQYIRELLEGKELTQTEKIDQVIEGKNHIPISTIKLKTGLDGRAIARYLRNTGEWERYTQGKTSRPVWTRKEREKE